MAASDKTPYERLFYDSLLIRRVEEKIIELYPSDKIQSPVHLSIGQEAASVGLAAAMEPNDWVFPTYRSHGIYIARGGDLNVMFAELYGKQGGAAKGKAGSMHLTAPDVGVMGASAVVSSSIPHAVGAAYASRLKGESRVHVAMFGDGATEEGVYHECVNFAALHRLPVLFFCENNDLAIHSKRAARQSYDLRRQARSYGVEAHLIRAGADFMAIAETLKPIVDGVRASKGPAFVEVIVYRRKEHVGIGDDFRFGYRGAEEMAAWVDADPLDQDAATRDRFEAEISAQIEAAVSFAEESPWPGADELMTDCDTPAGAQADSLAWACVDPAAITGPMSYREALMISMRNALATNDQALLVGQGVDDFKGTFGTTLNLHEEFGAPRCLDTPLAEEGVAGVALGMALNGVYPIQTHIRADFMLLASNQIINLIAKYRYMFGGRYHVPLLIRAVIGRSWGQGAQHSQSPQSLFAHIPGLTVIMPATAQSVLDSYAYATQHYPGPVLSIEHRLLYELEFDMDPAALERPGMPLASRKLRTGGDVTIVASSIMVLEALRAAKHLEETAGISCDVIDLHCVSHPDETMITESVKRTGKLVVADTSWIPFGTAAEICRIVAQACPEALKAPVETLGMARTPCPTAKSLEDIYYPTIGDMVGAAARLVRGGEDHGVPVPAETSMTQTYRHFKGPF